MGREGQGSFCPLLRASPAREGWLSDALLQGCSAPAVPTPCKPSEAVGCPGRRGGRYLQGWCRTPAGCSTRGCRRSCRTRTRWLPAGAQSNRVSPPLARLNPTSHPKNTPGGPSHSRTPLWRRAGPSPPGGANSTRGPQDPSGPGASLTIKAEKPPFFGTLATGKWGSPLTAGKKVSLSPLVMRKGWRQTNVLGQNSFLLRIT